MKRIYEWFTNKAQGIICMNNTEYVYGTAGSLLMECPACKKKHHRSAIKVLRFRRKEYCAWCADVELIPARKGVGE